MIYRVNKGLKRSIRGESSIGLTALYFIALNRIVGITAFLRNYSANLNTLDDNSDTPYI